MNLGQSDVTDDDDDRPLVRHLQRSAVPEIAMLASEIADEVEAFQTKVEPTSRGQNV